MAISEDELAAALRVLEASRELDPADPRFLALERAAAHLRKHAKKKRRADRRRATAAHDRAARATATLGGASTDDASSDDARSDGARSEGARADGARSTLRARRCYVCKQPYRQLHGFYHLLCTRCGDASAAIREARIDLRGRRVLITGGRIKIGFATALRCLRAGAEVVVTTRFPVDAARRYAQERDVDAWRERLTIHGLDFRHLPELLGALEIWRAGPAIDVLINNAAQTVWHPPSHYEALEAGERRPPALPVERRRDHVDPGAALEIGLAAIDRRRTNSWTLELEDVPPLEMVEAQVVNNIAPFLLCSRLQPAMLRSRHPDRYIVNVAALEGQFHRADDKSPRHPHTNMAKAALNMLTRTSAQAYAARGVYMVSVDPGWVSHEGPAHVRERLEAQGFRPPLSMADAAARILDPVARGLAGRPVFGVLLKDYAEVPW